MSRASGANDTGEDIFIGARPTPILACGLYGPIRNTVDIAVMDVEQFPEVGKIVGASAALADPILRELVVHPVGQLVAVRKLNVPEHLIPRHQAPPSTSKILADPWPSALQYLNGSGFGEVNLGITAVAVSPNGRFIAVCERHKESLKNSPSTRPVQQRPSFLKHKNSSLTTIDYPTTRIRVYFSATGMKLSTLECCTEGADWTSVAFSSDSMQIASACDNDAGLVALWKWYTPSIENEAPMGDNDSFDSPPKHQSIGHAATPLYGKSSVPASAHINRVRFLPTPTAKLEDMPTVLTTCGDNHLSFWTHKVVDPSDEGMLESRSLLNGLDLSGGEMLTDHTWLILKKGGCDPHPLLVAVTSRDKTDTASIYCFNQDGDCVCGNSDLGGKVALHIPLQSPSCCTESICNVPGKGFVVVGSCGLVAFVSVQAKSHAGGLGNSEISPELRLSGLLRLDSLSNDSAFLSSCPADTTGLSRWFAGVNYLPLSQKILLYSKDNQILTLALEALVGSSAQSSSELIGQKQAAVGVLSKVSSMKQVTPTCRLGELFANGPHFGPVLSMDAARDKPFVATIAKDGAVRIWNMMRGACEICFKCNSVGDEPLVVAFHPAGNLLAVGFRDRLRFYTILHKAASLCFSHEWQMKGIRALAFDGEGKSLAAAVGINVMIFDPYIRTQKGVTLTGHIKPVGVLRWASSGRRLWTTGTDGNVFGWDLTHSTEPGKRLDDLQLLNRSGISAAYLALVVRTDDHNEAIADPQIDPVSPFSSMKAIAKMADKKHKGLLSGEERSMAGTVASIDDDDMTVTSMDKSIGKHSVVSIAVGELSYAVAAGVEGGLREVRWDRGLPDSHTLRDIAGPVFTSLELDDAASLLYAGTINGSVRVYKWPLTDNAAHLEFPAHSGPPRPLATVSDRQDGPGSPERIRSNQTASSALTPTVHNLDKSAAVSAIRLVRHGRVMLTCGGDGSLICHAIAMVAIDDRLGEEVVIRPATTVMPLNAAEEAEEYNTDTVMVTTEYLNELHNTEMEIIKTVQDLQSDLEFSLHQLNTDSADKLKKTDLAARKAQDIADEEYKQLESEVATMKQQHGDLGQDTLDKQAATMAKMEGAYEQQLGESMARFEKMSSSVLNVKMNASRVLEEREVLIKKELRRRARRDGRRARLLQAHADKLGEEYRHGNRFHRMSLMQQEAEYESEVAKLMDAMTKELKEQRLLTVSFKSRAQLANTKSKQMARRLEDMKSAIQVTEKKSGEIMKLNAALEGKVSSLEVEVASKQEELDDCEVEEKAMTAEHQRLETFRFVLKAKANDMEDEKTPLEQAVERLEEAKNEANDVLITEFAAKAKAAQKLEEMFQSEAQLARDVKAVRAQSARLEQRIESFKRELCSLVEGNLLDADRLREGAVTLAKKYLFEGEVSRMGGDGGKREKELLAEATNSFGEVLLKEEMTAVVRERNLMQAELRASAGAKARVEASSKRAAVVRVTENTFMIDECNRLRRENLQAKRDQTGLERLVAAWTGGGSPSSDTHSKLDGPMDLSASVMDESLPSTVMQAGLTQNSLNDGVSLSASTYKPLAQDGESVPDLPIEAPTELPTMPEVPVKHERKASILPIIQPPNAPHIKTLPKKKRSKVPTTLRGSVNALAALEMEGDELVYALQKTRMTIASQHGEIQELRRAAHGIPSKRQLPSFDSSGPPSSNWLDSTSDDKSETSKTQRGMGYGQAAEEASVLSFTSSFSSDLAKKGEPLAC